MALIVAGASCRAGLAPVASGVDQLLVPEGAAITTKLKGYEDGGAHVGFDLTIHGGEPDLTLRLQEHYQREGWKPRAMQWMNPSHPTSFAIGWHVSGGGVLRHDSAGNLITTKVYEWRGQWDNARSDVISYYLRKEANSIRAYAEYHTAETIVSMRLQMRSPR